MKIIVHFKDGRTGTINVEPHQIEEDFFKLLDGRVFKKIGEGEFKEV